MKKVLNFVDGYKTYLMTIIIAVYNLAVACGWLPVAAQADINLILSSGLAAAFRSAISKLQ